MGHSKERYGRQIGSIRCLTGHTTESSRQLALPIRYKAPSILKFWKNSAPFALSEVEMSETFSQLWLALGSLKVLDNRLYSTTENTTVFGVTTSMTQPYSWESPD